MDKDDFYAAQTMESDGWEYIRFDGEWMVFTRLIAGRVYTARVGKR